jgi:RNA polymerase primary sigma factor
VRCSALILPSLVIRLQSMSDLEPPSDLPPASPGEGSVDRAVQALELGAAGEGCVGVSALDQVGIDLSLDEGELVEVRDRLAGAGIDVRDDCGHAAAPATSFTHHELAERTTDALQLLLGEARRYPLLTHERELELARRIERGDLQAKEALINHNLRLVVAQARRYQGLGDLALLDLVQEGMLGLIRAAEKFDWRRGLRFSTYATLWIRESIQRGLADRGRTIRLPVGVAQRERKVAAAERALATKLGRDPTDEETATAAGVTVAQVDDAHRHPRTTTSLDLPVGEEGGSTLGSLIPSEEPPVEEEVLIELTEEAVHRSVDALPERERAIVRWRFGLDGEEPLTLAEIGVRLELSTERVRQLERRALTLLSHRRELAALAEAA